MTNIQRTSIIVSVVVSLVFIGGAVAYSLQNKPTAQTTARVQRPVSKSELIKADGKNGHICYVAIDNMVYEIEGFALWQNGQHKTSNGLAYCGADMSKVIDKAPHGRRILDILPKVGQLTS